MGRHGKMSYLADELARARRADPHRILPGCRSILVLAIRYPAPPPALSAVDSSAPEGRGARGRVAAYAWGEDYHLVLPKRLQALAAFIESRAGHPVLNHWYTDTGPILERDLAQRAGLGWIGKNTCLINPRLGSYVMLAEILLSIELDPDPPFEADRCGRCTRCIQACPTGCILPDRTLDARRCISYLTIELKGSIPSDLRALLGGWVFGCDICQMVCPWNRSAAFSTELRAGPEGEAAFAPRPEITCPDLLQELALTSEEFNRKFKDSPIKRAKRHGYLRNVAVALGNAHDPIAILALERALHDSEPLVREHAKWTLDRMRNEHSGVRRLADGK